MLNIADIYTDSVRDNLRPLFANWDPGKEVRLGDFGVLRGSTLVYLGNVESLGVQVAARTNSTGDHKWFASAGSADVSFNSKGGVSVGGAHASASVEIKFSSAGSVFFSAAGCTYSMVADKVELGRSIMKHLHDGRWQREWAIVTDLVRANSIAIAVSAGGSGSLVLEASADVPRIDLADASIGLSVRSSSNLGYHNVSQKPMMPLFGLCKIQSTFLWWNDEFLPLGRTFQTSSALLSTVEDSSLIRTEQSPEGMHFGQVR